MEISTIKVIANPKKEWAQKTKEEVEEYLVANEYGVVGRTKFKTRNSKRSADLTICIGGDGTILYANHKHDLEGVVVGIGSSTSYFCSLRNDNWKDNLLELLQEGKIQKRITLNIKVGNKTYQALNDCVIHTHDYRVIRIFGSYGEETFDFEGDGMIVSTPNGSSAYAYSAGGKIMSPKSTKIQLVPICAYMRRFTPRIVPGTTQIVLSADRTNDIITDGIYITRINPQETVTITKGTPCTFLIEKKY